MVRTASIHKLVSWVSAASIISSIVVLPAGLARAGFISGPAQMLSQGPCLFSTQLQKSVSERKRYLVALSAATGGDAPSSVEAMYSDVRQASYSGDGPADDDPWGLGSKAPVSTAGVDSFSADCLSCHDGASAVSIGANVRNDPFKRGRHAKSGTDHPVGMDYQSYVSANIGKYKPVFGLGTKMVFIDGKVGCLTCHDPLNPERKHLVMSDYRSALCLTCHDK